MKLFIHDYLINSAAKNPTKVALVHAGKRYTYSDLLTATKSIACWLQEQNYPVGFRGAILTDDPFEYITSYFAILMAGGVAVGLNTQTSGRSLRVVLNDSTPSLLFLHAKFQRYLSAAATSIEHEMVVVGRNLKKTTPEELIITLQELDEILRYPSDGFLEDVELDPSSLAQLIYTSGTTGTPKGVMLRHSNLIANTESIIGYLGLTENDRVMAVLPFFYSYGNSIMLTHIAVGASLVVNQNFLYPNTVLDEMIAENVTGFSGVPSTFAILLHRSAIHDYVFPSLRYLTQAGAAMSPALARQLQDVFPDVPIYIMYGQTEASARLSYLAPDDLLAKAGSIGKAIPGVTLKLLDKAAEPVSLGEVGEIVAQGDNIMAGYWRKPEETNQVLRQGELWTGDLARQDDEGYFYIVSRKTEMIKSGSHRIAPKEIEEVLHEHEAVHEVAVIGVADEILGEGIKACVVQKDGCDCTNRELIKHCRKNLPAFKVPHVIEMYKALPKTATGKIKKAELE